MAVNLQQLCYNTDITLEIFSKLGLKEAVKWCSVSQLFNKIISSDYFLSRIAPQIFELEKPGIKERINAHAVTSKTVINERFKKLLKECGAFGNLLFTVYFPNNTAYKIVIKNLAQTENRYIGHNDHCVYMDPLPETDIHVRNNCTLIGGFDAVIDTTYTSLDMHSIFYRKYECPIISEICNEADLAIQAIQPEFAKEKEAAFKTLMFYLTCFLIIRTVYYMW